MKAVAMYEAYFNLPKRPFSSTPDPTCFFAPESIQEIFDELILRTESGQGIGIVTAHAGTGKTLLCRRIASELLGRWTPVFLANANFPTRRALLQSILFELGKPYSGLEEQELRLSIFTLLRELTRTGRGVALIVDEAHLLNDRLLEELRLLASLADGKLPLARVILAGQPSLEERMMAPALEALNQRVACHVYLEPLTRRQSIEYVDYRIQWAGGVCSQVFTDAALERIAASAGGLPRCLNQLCDHALLLTYVHEQTRVTGEIVEEALLALRQLPLRWNTPIAAGQVSGPFGEDHPGKVYPVQDPLSDDEQALCDYSSDDLRETRQNMKCAETACIEIGGDVTMTNSSSESMEYVSTDANPELANLDCEYEDAPPLAASAESMTQRRSVAGLAGAGVVPLPDASPSALRGLVDEPVVDRYAMLDSNSPRLMRTFDDAAVPECWLTTKHNDIPAAPQPPTTSAWSAADLVIERIDSVANDEVKDDPQFVETADLESIDIDDLLGSRVLDACLEVQAAIDGPEVDEHRDTQWWNDLDCVANADDENVIVQPAEEYAGKYDIIEPEHGSCDEPRYETPLVSLPPEEALSGSRPPATQSQGRYVPEPKYRNIFSTLRRRIGRGK